MGGRIVSVLVSYKGKAHCIVEIQESRALYDLARAIISAVGFDFDHAFGFYSNARAFFKSTEAYELFVDLGEPSSAKKAKSVKIPKIADVFIPNKKMTFLFGNSDEWIFQIKCIGMSDSQPKTRYPKVVERVGKFPKQY